MYDVFCFLFPSQRATLLQKDGSKHTNLHTYASNGAAGMFILAFMHCLGIHFSPPLCAPSSGWLCEVVSLLFHARWRDRAASVGKIAIGEDSPQFLCTGIQDALFVVFYPWWRRKKNLTTMHTSECLYVCVCVSNCTTTRFSCIVFTDPLAQWNLLLTAWLEDEMGLEVLRFSSPFLHPTFPSITLFDDGWIELQLSN